MVKFLWRTVWRFLKKKNKKQKKNPLKTELPNGPAIPFLGMYLEKVMV